MSDPFWDAYQGAPEAERKRYDDAQRRIWEEHRQGRRAANTAHAAKIRPFRSKLETAEREATHEFEATRTRIRAELAAAQRKAKEELASATRLRDSRVASARRDYEVGARPLLDARAKGSREAGATRDAAIAKLKLETFGVSG